MHTRVKIARRKVFMIVYGEDEMNNLEKGRGVFNMRVSEVPCLPTFGELASAICHTLRHEDCDTVSELVE